MRIVISDCAQASIDPEVAVITVAGLEAPAWLQCKTEDDVIRECKGAVGIINQYAPITRNVLAALAPELKQIVRYGVGVNNVDLVASTEFGVQVSNVPDYGMNEVSDHTLALMLGMSRKLVFMANKTKAGEWDYIDSIPLFRLCDQTVGTVGMGRNGRLFARKAAALGCRVIGYDAYYTPTGEDAYITKVTLEELIRESDFVVLNCPLTDETCNMFSDDAFKNMKNTAYIINAARGGIIDEDALIRALKAKEIAGAALDTTEEEPLPMDSPLRTFDNCILTPHMAWYSEQATFDLKRKAAEEAVRGAKGQKVHYPVNVLS